MGPYALLLAYDIEPPSLPTSSPENVLPENHSFHELFEKMDFIQANIHAVNGTGKHDTSVSDEYTFHKKVNLNDFYSTALKSRSIT